MAEFCTLCVHVQRLFLVRIGWLQLKHCRVIVIVLVLVLVLVCLCLCLCQSTKQADRYFQEGYLKQIRENIRVFISRVFAMKEKQGKRQRIYRPSCSHTIASVRTISRVEFFRPLDTKN